MNKFLVTKLSIDDVNTLYSHSIEHLGQVMEDFFADENGYGLLIYKEGYESIVKKKDNGKNAETLKDWKKQSGR